VREFLRAKAEVRVVMTAAAQQFVTPLTFQALSGQPVLTNYYDTRQEGQFGHLDVARWAELFVVAPATADLLARIRAGMGQDAVTTSLLAYRGPVLLAPAMNVAMWENRLTQENIAALKTEARFHQVGPGVGPMADGDVGPGRLSEVPEIVDAAARIFSKGPLSGKKVLVTAGPTREYLDPVRFLSNPSTGKMGLALAHAARKLGAEVTVVLGPVENAVRDGLKVVDVVSAEDMAQEVLSRVSSVDYFIATAAVSDFRPEEKLPQKKKKSTGEEAVRFVKTVDVLLEASKKVHASSTRPVLVGFAAETENVFDYAEKKLTQKKLDAIVANDVSAPSAGFASDSNTVTVLTKTGQRHDFSGSKQEVAERIWSALLTSDGEGRVDVSSDSPHPRRLNFES
jgi:phosphopantothenoylcysteine decarboxylase/phosphopantothenate--cysteine ligase